MNIPVQRKQPGNPAAEQGGAPPPTGAQMRTPMQGAANAPSPPPPPAPVEGGFTPMGGASPATLVAPRQVPSMAGAAGNLDPAALLQLLMGKPYTPPAPMGPGGAPPPGGAPSGY